MMTRDQAIAFAKQVEGCSPAGGIHETQNDALNWARFLNYLHGERIHTPSRILEQDHWAWGKWRVVKKDTP